MPTTVKKQRRRSGVKFTKAPKTPTPLAERREFRPTVLGAIGTRMAGRTVPRAPKQLAKVQKAWGIADA